MYLHYSSYQLCLGCNIGQSLGEVIVSRRWMWDRSLQQCYFLSTVFDCNDKTLLGLHVGGAQSTI